MSTQLACHLPKSKLKHCVSLRQARTVAGDVYVGLEHIEPWAGHLQEGIGSAHDSDEEGRGANTFEPGDVLFSKLRPYLAKAWIADRHGQCTGELLVMVPRLLQGRFLLYVLLSKWFIDLVSSYTYGSKMPRVDWSIISNVEVPSPPTRTQHLIADYLDEATARVDSVIAAKRHLIGLLDEKRQAVITRAVMRGLDSSVPFVDSGIEWLGKIPIHWQTRRVSWLFKERDERGAPELPLLEVSINAGVVIREFSDDRIEATASDFNSYKVARQGDVVFNKMRMWQGAVGVAPVDGLVSPDYVVAKPVGGLSSSYAGQLFRTSVFSAECARRSRGITWDRFRLYWDGFREIKVPLPPHEEQTRIIAHLDRTLVKLDSLTAATHRSIEILRERRAALIAAAVTGQIIVGGEAARAGR